MSLDRKADFEPLQVAGADIQVAISAGHFWAWERKAKTALEAVHSDPPKAVQALREIADDMARMFALAREDDPSLPDHYRQFLP